MFIIPDNYPSEITWDIVIDGASFDPGSSTEFEYSSWLPRGNCIIFTIFDAFGDGICCNYGQGSYTLKVNGVVIKTGGEYDSYESTIVMGCEPGSPPANQPPSEPPSPYVAPTLPPPQPKEPPPPPPPPPVYKHELWEELSGSNRLYRSATTTEGDFLNQCKADCLSRVDCEGFKDLLPTDKHSMEVCGSDAMGNVQRCCLLMTGARVSPDCMFPYFALNAGGESMHVIKYMGPSTGVTARTRKDRRQLTAPTRGSHAEANQAAAKSGSRSDSSTDGWGYTTLSVMSAVAAVSGSLIGFMTGKARIMLRSSSVIAPSY